MNAGKSVTRIVFGAAGKSVFKAVIAMSSDKL